MSRDEHVEAEEGLDSNVTIDEHDVTSDETVVDDLKITRSAGPGNEDDVVAGDNDDDEEEDSEGEETVEDLIHELEALEGESEPGFHPLIRALYHAVSLSPIYVCFVSGWNCLRSEQLTLSFCIDD